MSKKDGRDFLFLIWKDPKTRQNFVIGELSKNGLYEFKYIDDIENALTKGFTLLPAFPDKTITYKSQEMFSSFSSRLPDKKRRDIQQILSKYHLSEYDEYALLKRSGAKLPIDNLNFIEPIFDTDENVERCFFIAGPRHYLGCNGEKCEDMPSVDIGDPVLLELEPSNTHDNNAVKILTESKKTLGYIPRYYSIGIFQRLKKNHTYKCTISNIHEEKNCNECIEVCLSISS